jgi:hypothetical protein
VEHTVSYTVVDHPVLHYTLRLMNAIRQLHRMIVFVRRLLIVLMLIGVVTIPYAVGQWIDGDNLVRDLSLKPFWIYQLRECMAC